MPNIPSPLDAPDGFAAQGQGMNGSINPLIIPPDAYARGLNVTARGSLLQTRPGWTEESISGMPTTVFQGGAVWRLNGGDYLAFVSGGRIYVITISTLALTDLGAHMDTTAQCFVQQHEKYIVVQDGVSAPQILEVTAGVPAIVVTLSDAISMSVVPGVLDFDGTAHEVTIELASLITAKEDYGVYITKDDGTVFAATMRDVASAPVYTFGWDPATANAPVAVTEMDDTAIVTVAVRPTIPIGYMSVYAFGRIHLVPKLIPSTSEEGRTSIVSGDIQLLNDPKSMLQFTEVEYLNEGGAHAMPLEMGFVGALGVYRNAPTGTGLGEVLSIGQNGVAGFDFSLSRDTQWKSQSLSRVLYFGAGSRSPWATYNVNNDLLYRGYDGIRSIRYSGSQIAGQGGTLSNVPISLEITTFLQQDAAFLPYVSITDVDNRVFMTAAGTDTRYFQGLVSWDVAAPFYNGAAGVGAYDGMWTGFNAGQVFRARRSDVDTLYAIAEGLKLYRSDPAATIDTPVTGSASPIESRIETRSMAFGTIDATKRLEKVTLWASNIVRDTTFKIYVRPHGYPLWSEIGAKAVKVGSGSLPQMRREVLIPIDFSSQLCDASTSELLYHGRAFQFAVEWTGFARLTRFAAEATQVGSEPADPCDETTSVDLVASAATGVMLSDFSYVI